MDDPITAVGKWVDDIVKHVKEVAEQCIKESAQELIPEIAMDVDNVFAEAVLQWYSSYSPAFYRRNESLYGIMDLEQSPEELMLEWTFDGGKMTRDRHGGSLFDKVFVHGWHGGAYAGDTIRYRKPVPKSMGGNASGVGFYRWGRRAVRTPSPYFLFQKKEKVLEKSYSQRMVALATEKLNARF